MNYSWHTGEIVDIIPDGGSDWAVLEFPNKKLDILSVPSNILEAAGVEPLERGVPVSVLLNDDATCEIDLNPQEYRPLS
jgi:hypothetical protein